MNKTIFIAEAGVNHNGKMTIAKKLIDAAKKADADYVKFQIFKTDNLVTKKSPLAEYQKINSPQFGGAMMWSINKDINDQFYTAVRPAIARGPGPQNCQTCCSFSTSGTYTGPLNPKAYTDLNCPGQIAAGRESNHIFDNTSPRGTTCDATAGLPPNLLLINRTYNLSCTKSWSSL